ncbi:MAG: hydroxyacid dehydrogenase [Verrucomicrobia bacterium]|nr:hydroxyacid dehydrogenase [Verrucomicrobiota bacterium]
MLKGLVVIDHYALEVIYGDSGVAKIRERIALIAPPLTRDELLASPELLAEAEVIFSGWSAPCMDAAFLARAPRLRAVFYGAGSIRHFTTDAFWDRDILVTSAYAMNAVPVAEFALASILFSLKRGWYYTLETKRLGHFPPTVTVPGAYGAKVGLISLGMIARLLRDRLRTFDLEVWVYDPFLTPAQAEALQVKLVSLDELFRHCDVVSLHAPWLKETENLITGAHFELMKSGATFLNTARGAIVNETEMIAVLERRPDLTVLLDVTHPEPPVPGSPLYTLPNVVLTPHIAGSLGPECRRMGQLMIDEFDRWTRGEPLQWQISREKAALLA